MFLGMIPNLIFWQEGGLRAPIRCYLDSILPGRSGLFTPPEAWLSRPAHLQPEGGWSQTHSGEQRTGRVGGEESGGRLGCRSGLQSVQGRATLEWQSIWPIWRESWPKCVEGMAAEGGCRWWMEVVRCSNCAQVIDLTPRPPFPFSLPSQRAKYSVSLSCVWRKSERKHQLHAYLDFPSSAEKWDMDHAPVSFFTAVTDNCC